MAGTQNTLKFGMLNLELKNTNGIHQFNTKISIFQQKSYKNFPGYRSFWEVFI